MPNRHDLLSLVLLLAPMTAQDQTPPPAPTPKPPASVHAPFDRLLGKYTKDGLVDYEGLRRDDAATLHTYLDTLAKVDVAKLAKPEQFAFYANLYNATMIDAVLEHTATDPKWTPAAKEFAVFKEKRVRLASGTTTLDALENEILRPQFKDPRVHVALVCGARSCPPLRAQAYEADRLDAVLDQKLAAFLHDETRNQVDANSETVRLSKIFEWFQADFGGEAGVRKLLAKQFDAKVARYKLAYLDYSWELNRQPQHK